MAHLKSLSKENFESEILGRPGFVLVDFWAPWCATCRALLPILEELAARYDGRMSFAQISVEVDPVRAVSLGVRGLPTFIFMKNGVEIDRVVGAICRTEIMRRIDRHLTTDSPGSSTAAPPPRTRADRPAL